MSWTLLDDHLDTDDKIVQLSAISGWLWAMGLVGANRAKPPTGHVPRARIEYLRRNWPEIKPKHIQQLVAVGLWEPREDGGYQIHAFKPRPTSTERVRRHRNAVRNADETVPGGVTETPRNANGTKPETLRNTSPARRPYPTQPNPSEGTKAPLAPAPRVRAREAEGPSEHPLVLAVARRYEERAGYPPSGRDLEWLRHAPLEYPRLTETQALETVDQLGEKFIASGRAVPPLSYLAGRWRELDMRAADQGAQPRRPKGVPGMQSVGDILGGGGR